MNTIGHHHLDFTRDEDLALLDGAPFTGRSVATTSHETSAQVYVDGLMEGPSASWDSSGRLTFLGWIHGGGMPVGVRHRWDPAGALILEEVNDTAGNQRLTRRWDASGRLVSEGHRPRLFASSDPGTGEKVFLAWQQLRVSAAMPRPAHQEFLVVPDIDDLAVENVEGLGRRVLFQGSPYTGEAVTRDHRGRVEMHTFVGGVEDGPTLAWSPSGKLVVQGLTQHPHGPVGPWHQWDGQGRLLRETVHDALGNRVIVRELDQAGNIIREERRAPTRLARDPETGREHPAPWL